MSRPIYQIGDRLHGTELTVRGIAVLKNGKIRYFRQLADETFVFEETEVGDINVLAEYIKRDLSQ